MLINAQTRIGIILKERADALNTIFSISPKFEKLRNPVLRKLIASRTSIAAAAKIGQCQVSDFFDKLKPLGFEIDTANVALDREKQKVPAFMLKLAKEQLTALDVRPAIASGKDPLNLILQKIKLMKPGQVLKIINSFYPEPLILLLKKQGFEAFSDTVDDNPVESYFYKKDGITTQTDQPVVEAYEGWDEVLQKYEGKFKVVDVRSLEMPLPMMTILDELDKLPSDTALFIYHKRIPVYLLPELVDRKFNYRIKEISDREVNLLIYKG
jgi:uncharacterized protein (DUF2249 family)